MIFVFMSWPPVFRRKLICQPHQLITSSNWAFFQLMGALMAQRKRMMITMASGREGGQ